MLRIYFQDNTSYCSVRDEMERSLCSRVYLSRELKSQTAIRLLDQVELPSLSVITRCLFSENLTKPLSLQNVYNLILVQGILYPTLYIFYQQQGDIYVSHDCSEYCTCEGGSLECTATECGENAICDIKNGIPACYCDDGFEGDGQNCVTGKHALL